ncbi:unnamed protein product [Closterium sp. Naga37s-1]|nr:unnamed protein product [Closterium sp. Naga37s-1]
MSSSGRSSSSSNTAFSSDRSVASSVASCSSARAPPSLPHPAASDSAAPDTAAPDSAAPDTDIPDTTVPASAPAVPPWDIRASPAAGSAGVQQASGDVFIPWPAHVRAALASPQQQQQQQQFTLFLQQQQQGLQGAVQLEQQPDISLFQHQHQQQHQQQLFAFQQQQGVRRTGDCVGTCLTSLEVLLNPFCARATHHLPLHSPAFSMASNSSAPSSNGPSPLAPWHHPQQQQAFPPPHGLMPPPQPRPSQQQNHVSFQLQPPSQQQHSQQQGGGDMGVGMDMELSIQLPARRWPPTLAAVTPGRSLTASVLGRGPTPHRPTRKPTAPPASPPPHPQAHRPTRKPTAPPVSPPPHPQAHRPTRKPTAPSASPPPHPQAHRPTRKPTAPPPTSHLARACYHYHRSIYLPSTAAPFLPSAPPPHLLHSTPHATVLCPAFPANIRTLFNIERKALGEGQYGKVYVCTEKATGVRYACKTIARSSLISVEDVEDVRMEVRPCTWSLASSLVSVLFRLQGQPNVVRVHSTYEDRRDIHIVMELCSGGELFDEINRRCDEMTVPYRCDEMTVPYRGSERDAAKLCKAVVRAVHSCHSSGVIHRDLKPENFLFSSAGADAVLKAADFGMAAYFKPGEGFTRVCGSCMYMAPEVIRIWENLGKQRYGPPVDIWACGVIFYILLAGNYPFLPQGPDRSERAFRRVILQPQRLFREAVWGRISADAKSLIAAMLHPDPALRPTAQQVLGVADDLTFTSCTLLIAFVFLVLLPPGSFDPLLFSPPPRLPVATALPRSPHSHPPRPSPLLPWCAAWPRTEHTWIVRAPDEPLEKDVVDRFKQFLYVMRLKKVKKVALRAMVEGMGEDDIRVVQGDLGRLDPNATGVVPIEALPHALHSRGFHGPADAVASIIHEICLDGKVAFDYADFFVALLQLCGVEQQENLFQAFSVFDQDLSGYISEAELQRACEKYRVNRQVVQEMMAEVNRDEVRGKGVDRWLQAHSHQLSSPSFSTSIPLPPLFVVSTCERGQGTAVEASNMRHCAACTPMCLRAPSFNHPSPPRMYGGWQAGRVDYNEFVAMMRMQAGGVSRRTIERHMDNGSIKEMDHGGGASGPYDGDSDDMRSDAACAAADTASVGNGGGF